MPSKPNKTYWHICIVAVVVLSIITFTPLVIPKGVYEPMVLGIPYTFWVTFLIMIIYVVLTFIGTRIHPGRHEDDD